MIGAKPPLRPKHVWSIRTKLQVEGPKRDLALFNLAIDSKLRGCDVVSVRVEDVAPRGYATDRLWLRTTSRSPSRLADFITPTRHSDRQRAARLFAEVVSQDMVITDGKVDAYRTKVKVSFKFEGTP